MFSFFYNLSLILLGILALPRLLWQWKVKGKYRQSLAFRLGLKRPAFVPSSHQKVIWIHSVSVGETRAVIPLFRLLKERWPEAAVVVSTTTETGLAEAKRSMPEANSHFFLPLDFSWVIRRFLRQMHPDLLILVESDFWYHLVKIAKQMGTKVVLVNGKISEKSCERFRKSPFFSRRLFGQFDHFALQSHTYAERFKKMGIDPKQITVTGNMKLDASLKKMDPTELSAWKTTLGLSPEDRVLVIGSSHAPEEEWLLSALAPVWQKIPHLKVLLVPRHPERFKEVAELLAKRPTSSISFSKLKEKTGSEQVILIDAMGQLNACYQLAEIAIVAGSFTERIGGHNIFEPILLGIPALFGPHMQGQRDLVELALAGGAGKQLTLAEISSFLIHYLQNTQEQKKLKRACEQLTSQVHGSVQRTSDILAL